MARPILPVSDVEPGWSDSSELVDLGALSRLVEESPVRDRYRIGSEPVLRHVSLLGHADVHMDGPAPRFGPDRISLVVCTQEDLGVGLPPNTDGWFENDPRPVGALPDAGLTHQLGFDRPPAGVKVE